MGAALPGDTAQLRAELLRAMQQAATVDADRSAALAVLALIGGEVDAVIASDPIYPVALAFSDHAGPKTYPEAYDRLVKTAANN